MDSDQKLLNKLNRRTSFTLFLVWIALFFTAVGIAAGYKNWLRIHDKAKAGLLGIAEIREQIPNFADKERLQKLQESVEKNIKSSDKYFDGALKELRHIQDSTQHIADTVYTQVEALTLKQETVKNIQQAPLVHDWSLTEVHFLLQTANQVLSIKHDKNGAVKALNLADQLLLNRGSTDFLPLRQQISQDLASVGQYMQPDIESLSEKISQLQFLLQPKSAIEEIVIEPDVSTVESLSEIEEQGEDSLVSRVKKTINQAVIVHKFNKPLYDEMDKENQNNLFQLLSLRLETLRIMLLQGRDKSYHAQIHRIKGLLKTSYSAEDSKPLIDPLIEMDQINLIPEIPDITKSLKLLESMLSKGNLN